MVYFGCSRAGAANTDAHEKHDLHQESAGVIQPGADKRVVLVENKDYHAVRSMHRG